MPIGPTDFAPGSAAKVLKVTTSHLDRKISAHICNMQAREDLLGMPMLYVIGWHRGQDRRWSQESVRNRQGLSRKDIA